MKEIIIVAIVFTSIVLALAIIPGTILIALRLFKDGFSRTKQKQGDAEAKMMQEIYKELARMEERVEALETILLDRDREERNQ